MNMCLGFGKLGNFKLVKIDARFVLGTCRHTFKLILTSVGCTISR